MEIKLIQEKKFEKAKKEMGEGSIAKYFDRILEAAFEEEDIVYYEFFEFLINDEPKNAELHFLASKLLATALNILPKAYNRAFDHAKKAIKLAPDDIEFKEYILLFYQIPDKLLETSIALKYSQEILEIDPENKAAALIMKNSF